VGCLEILKLSLLLQGDLVNGLIAAGHAPERNTCFVLYMQVNEHRSTVSSRDSTMKQNMHKK
jgi:hypothetical protein